MKQDQPNNFKNFTLSTTRPTSLFTQLFELLIAANFFFVLRAHHGQFILTCFGCSYEKIMKINERLSFSHSIFATYVYVTFLFLIHDTYAPLHVF